jgi:hypothetical protein
MKQPVTGLREPVTIHLPLVHIDADFFEIIVGIGAGRATDQEEGGQGNKPRAQTLSPCPRGRFPHALSPSSL